MSLTLRIPRRLESPNSWQGRHWRVKHRLSQEWEKEIWATAPSVGERLTRAAFKVRGPVRSRVVVERQVPSARNFIRDDDNLRFSVKPLLDALKRQGYIKNDSRQWLEHPTPTQAVSTDGKDWTVVTIDRVDTEQGA